MKKLLFISLVGLGHINMTTGIQHQVIKANQPTSVPITIKLSPQEFQSFTASATTSQTGSVPFSLQRIPKWTGPGSLSLGNPTPPNLTTLEKEFAVTYPSVTVSAPGEGILTLLISGTTEVGSVPIRLKVIK